MLIEILKQHIYLYIFILTIIEWPITSFVSAWLAAQSILNIKYVIVIALSWDIIMDIILYIIWITFNKYKFLGKFSIFNKQKNFLSKSIKKRPFLYLLIIKFTPYLAIPWLIFAGTKKMKFKKYLIYSFIISIFIKILYLTIWYTWSLWLKQLNHLIAGWKQIVLYIIISIFFFLFIKKSYSYIWTKIKSKLKN